MFGPVSSLRMPPWMYGFARRLGALVRGLAALGILVALMAASCRAGRLPAEGRIPHRVCPRAERMLSLAIYTTMAIAAAVGLSGASRSRTPPRPPALPIGAWFTVVPLGTGMLWGKPMWGRIGVDRA